MGCCRRWWLHMSGFLILSVASLVCTLGSLFPCLHVHSSSHPSSPICSAMARIDPATGRPRGFMRMGRHPRLDSVLFTLDVRDEHWRQASRWAGF